ncbi:MAG: hypothetical protein BGP14_13520 [Sphingobacteriales bacterium 44-15]|nr:MAG: hypothetical protein BGP14_13520 [Sphingobacteriales bacterium 44-15]
MERLIEKNTVKAVKQSLQLVKRGLLLPPQHSFNSNLDAGGIAKTRKSVDDFFSFRDNSGLQIIRSEAQLHS